MYPLINFLTFILQQNRWGIRFTDQMCFLAPIQQVSDN